MIIKTLFFDGNGRIERGLALDRNSDCSKNYLYVWERGGMPKGSCTPVNPSFASCSLKFSENIYGEGAVKITLKIMAELSFFNDGLPLCYPKTATLIAQNYFDWKESPVSNIKNVSCNVLEVSGCKISPYVNDHTTVDVPLKVSARIKLGVELHSQ